MYVLLDKSNKVLVSSNRPIGTIDNHVIQTDAAVGTRIPVPAKALADLRVALICNWNMPCGISTYSGFLAAALRNKVKEVRIFSEEGEPLQPDTPDVVRCWSRGSSMRQAINMVRDWQPDFTIVQHEFGIFPRATAFLQMLQMLEDMPYVVAMHSIYEHLDKTICTFAVRNLIVHSTQAKQVLETNGHRNRIWVIPHGCHHYDHVDELWNIFQTPYVIMQFGFGFFYKGVDRALKAVHYLKNHDPKFKDIFYSYLCSENTHNSAIHDEYCRNLMQMARDLDIEDNVAIVRGYQSDQSIQNYLRTAKLAIFPYVISSNNAVYGASGAVRLAMANRIPVIASESHLFDDLSGVLPRPEDEIALAKEIDEVFSNENYRTALLERIAAYTAKYTWDYTSDKYLQVYTEIVAS